VLVYHALLFFGLSSFIGKRRSSALRASNRRRGADSLFASSSSFSFIGWQRK
jgi:hypothetical protein